MSESDGGGSWPAGYIHFNKRLEEVGRSEQRDFIRANGDLRSGPTHKVQNKTRILWFEVIWLLYASESGAFFLTISGLFYSGTLR